MINTLVIHALGHHINDPSIKKLLAQFSEKPKIYDQPILKDDSDTVGYEFSQSGVMFGFDTKIKLKYVYFYLDKKDGFKPCKFKILPNISKQTTKEDILKMYGTPDKMRTVDKNKFFKFGVRLCDFYSYDMGSYKLHFEFSDETDKVQEVDFILNQGRVE